MHVMLKKYYCKYLPVLLLIILECYPGVKNLYGQFHLQELTEHTKQIMLRAVSCKPHTRQLAYQENEFTAFVHFGVNTFTGREWGTGFENPDIFNPRKLDTDQWCRAIKETGMKMVVFGAKHHDGFCLWQTRYTDHSVAGSPWKNGEGDVVQELAASCRKFGLKLGIYLSPADLFQIEHPQGLYGNRSSYSERVIPGPVEGRPFKDKRSFRYVVDDYNEYFMNQLFELLTEYGPVHEVWFDGAHPKRKGGQTYTYELWYDLIRKLAPQAVIAIKGPDVRWCGNEDGRTRESEWSVIPIGGSPEDWHWPDMMEEDLGSLEKIEEILEQGGFLHWYPAETNTSIRHGWFWRDELQYVKTTEEILDIWYRSVGGNSVFLLNIPPNRDGLFSQRDVEVLRSLGRVLKKTFASNLASGAMARASAERGPEYAARFMLDGNTETCWMPPDWTRQAEVTITLPEERRFNRIVFQEQIADFSQRISRFAIDAFVAEDWKEIAAGTTVGYKRICRTSVVRSDRLRIRILDSRVCPTISTFGLYYEEIRVSNPVIRRDKAGMVSLSCVPAGPVIYYTTDGSDPDSNAAVYSEPFEFCSGGMVKAVAVHPETRRESGIVARDFDLCPAKWEVLDVSSEQADNNEEGYRAIDGDPRTNWITRWRPDAPLHPHFITVDLGEVLNLKGFTYTPRGDADFNGTIKTYQFFVSTDGTSWGEPVSEGEFDNIVNDPTKKYVHFEKSIEARFIKLVALSEIRGNPWASAAEIGVITRNTQ